MDPGVSTEASVEAGVPAWLAARRARSPVAPASDSAADIEFEGIPDSQEPSQPEPTESVNYGKGLPPVLDSPQATREAASGSRLQDRRSAAPELPEPGFRSRGPVRESTNPKTLIEDRSIKALLVQWIRSSTTAGILVSAVFHTLALAILAVLVINSNSMDQALEVIGVFGENDAMADIELDSAMPFDPGQDAAPLEFPAASELVSDALAFNPGESLRGAPGGTGTGSGEGGEGEAMSVPSVNVPKYAVTKGSFSVWTDPKDPAPGISYHIVIQFRLPKNVKKYRANDLTGMVIGTDKYKQVIKFSRTESFPVEDGTVQVRIRVPGASRLVRDTIRIESRLLREKQVIEIEF